MSGDLRQRLGSAGERLAAEHLERRGFEIVERNYRTRWGELDLIAFDGRVLVFCEVKTRRAGSRRGGAARGRAPLQAGARAQDGVELAARPRAAAPATRRWFAATRSE